VNPARRVQERQVQELLEPLLAPTGIEVFDVELTAGAGAGVLRVTVDRPGGIDLEAVGRASTIVSSALDEADPIPGRYTLEVSSPGLERALRIPAHFQRHVGTTVSVKTKAATDGERRLQGTLEAADDEGCTVAGRTIAYDDIERARTVFEWGQPARAPRPRHKAAR